MLLIETSKEGSPPISTNEQNMKGAEAMIDETRRVTTATIAARLRINFARS